jgi:hypothetical protein
MSGFVPERSLLLTMTDEEFDELCDHNVAPDASLIRLTNLLAATDPSTPLATLGGTEEKRPTPTPSAPALDAAVSSTAAASGHALEQPSAPAQEVAACPAATASGHAQGPPAVSAQAQTSVLSSTSSSEWPPLPSVSTNSNGGKLQSWASVASAPAADAPPGRVVQLPPILRHPDHDMIAEHRRVKCASRAQKHAALFVEQVRDEVAKAAGALDAKKQMAAEARQDEIDDRPPPPPKPPTPSEVVRELAGASVVSLYCGREVFAHAWHGQRPRHTGADHDWLSSLPANQLGTGPSQVCAHIGACGCGKWDYFYCEEAAYFHDPAWFIDQCLNVRKTCGYIVVRDYRQPIGRCDDGRIEWCRRPDGSVAVQHTNENCARVHDSADWLWRDHSTFPRHDKLWTLTTVQVGAPWPNGQILFRVRAVETGLLTHAPTYNPGEVRTFESAMEDDAFGVLRCTGEKAELPQKLGMVSAYSAGDMLAAHFRRCTLPDDDELPERDVIISKPLMRKCILQMIDKKRTIATWVGLLSYAKLQTQNKPLPQIVLSGIIDTVYIAYHYNARKHRTFGVLNQARSTEIVETNAYFDEWTDRWSWVANAVFMTVASLVINALMGGLGWGVVSAVATPVLESSLFWKMAACFAILVAWYIRGVKGSSVRANVLSANYRHIDLSATRSNMHAVVEWLGAVGADPDSVPVGPGVFTPPPVLFEGKTPKQKKGCRIGEPRRLVEPGKRRACNIGWVFVGANSQMLTVQSSDEWSQQAAFLQRMGKEPATRPGALIPPPEWRMGEVRVWMLVEKVLVDYLDSRGIDEQEMYSFAEYLATMRPDQRQALIDGFRIIFDIGITIHTIGTSVFVKIEKCKPDPTKAPRAINSSTKEFNAAVAPLVKKFAKVLAAVLDIETSFIVYAPGVSAEALGRKFHDCVEAGMYVRENDRKRFDSTRSNESQQCYANLLRRYVKQQDDGIDRFKLLADGLSPRGFTISGAPFSVTDCMLSGRPPTTSDNTMAVLGVALTAYCLEHSCYPVPRAGLRTMELGELSVWASGDDSLIFSALPMRYHEEFETLSGAEPEEIPHERYHEGFCSSMFYPVVNVATGEDTHLPGMKICNALERLGTIVDPPATKKSVDKAAYAAGLMRSVALGLQQNNAHVPFVRAYIRKVLAATSSVKAVALGTKHKSWSHFAAVRARYEPRAETWVMVEEVWGVTQADEALFADSLPSYITGGVASEVADRILGMRASITAALPDAALEELVYKPLMGHRTFAVLEALLKFNVAAVIPALFHVAIETLPWWSRIALHAFYNAAVSSISGASRTSHALGSLNCAIENRNRVHNLRVADSTVKPVKQQQQVTEQHVRSGQFASGVRALPTSKVGSNQVHQGLPEGHSRSGRAMGQEVARRPPRRRRQRRRTSPRRHRAQPGPNPDGASSDDPPPRRSLARAPPTMDRQSGVSCGACTALGLRSHRERARSWRRVAIKHSTSRRQCRRDVRASARLSSSQDAPPTAIGWHRAQSWAGAQSAGHPAASEGGAAQSQPGHKSGPKVGRRVPEEVRSRDAAASQRVVHRPSRRLWRFEPYGRAGGCWPRGSHSIRCSSPRGAAHLPGRDRRHERLRQLRTGLEQRASLPGVVDLQVALTACAAVPSVSLVALRSRVRPILFVKSSGVGRARCPARPRCRWSRRQGVLHGSRWHRRRLRLGAPSAAHSRQPVSREETLYPRWHSARRPGSERVLSVRVHCRRRRSGCHDACGRAVGQCGLGSVRSHIVRFVWANADCAWSLGFGRFPGRWAAGRSNSDGLRRPVHWVRYRHGRGQCRRVGRRLGHPLHDATIGSLPRQLANYRDDSVDGRPDGVRVVNPERRNHSRARHLRRWDFLLPGIRQRDELQLQLHSGSGRRHSGRRSGCAVCVRERRDGVLHWHVHLPPVLPDTRPHVGSNRL